MLRIIAYVTAITLILVAVSFLLWHAFDYQLLRIYSGPDKEIDILEESEDPAEFIKDHPPEDLSIAMNGSNQSSTIRSSLQQAKILEAQENFAEAESLYRSLTKEHCFDPDVVYAYATFLARQGSFAHSAELVRSDPNLENDDPEGLVQFLNCYERSISCSPLTTATQGDWWSYLIESLALHDYESASKMIEENPFRVASWHPDLLLTVTYLLSYQKGRTLNALPIPTRKSSNTSKLRPFSQNLEALATLESQSPSLHVSQALRRTMISREIFACIFAAAGLHEAAAKLHEETTYPEEYPSWASIAMTHSLRQSRGPQEALNFAMSQYESDELRVEMGKLLLERGQKSEARQILNSLSENSSVIGSKAALLIAESAYSSGSYEEAKKIIDSNARLATSVKGRELLAKIALAKSDMIEADRLYTSIVANSRDAKSYFAKKALRRGNFTIAEKLTLELLVDKPSDTALQKQLKIISTTK
jgi:thioredoxin-like negative regulator of GroEL